MKTHSIGLIGYGGFGRFLHAAWSEIDGVEVSAVSDADSARDPGGVRFYADWRGLVSDRDLDIVAIATPPSMHTAMALEALGGGKHVLVEKPVATTMRDAERLRSARDQSDRRVTVDFMLRFNPIVEAVHSWCRSGCFGRLRRVAVENYAQDETLPPDHWFWDPVISGGILVEHAVHFLDIVQWCSASKPVQIDGLSLERKTGQEDRVMATVVHEDGLVATHYHSFAGPASFERTSMRFVFDLLQIDIAGWIPMSGGLSAITTEETEKELTALPGFRAVSRTATGLQGEFSLPVTKSEAYTAALQALMVDFILAIDSPDHTLRVSLDDGIASLGIALAATEDARRRYGRID